MGVFQAGSLGKEAKRWVSEWIPGLPLAFRSKRLNMTLESLPNQPAAISPASHASLTRTPINEINWGPGRQAKGSWRPHWRASHICRCTPQAPAPHRGGPLPKPQAPGFPRQGSLGDKTEDPAPGHRDKKKRRQNFPLAKSI